ncbi:MAG TPA: ATP-binding protein [Candidatus Angelobacter sp.]|nr:ATP-binding protein [Candidatus Angelobacter sp.]
MAQVFLGSLASLAALEAARLSNPFARRVWLRAALAIAIYSAGQAILTYRIAVHAPSAGPFSTDIIFFFWMLPILASAVIDSSETPAGFDWASVLDFFQLALLAVALHLSVFGDAAGWHSPTEQMLLLKWKGRALRDLVILACLYGRAYVSNRQMTRGLFLRLGVFYLAYSLADILYLYSEASRHIRPGTTMDLLWSAPRVLLVVLALSWKGQPAQDQVRAVPNWRRRCMVLYWAPVVVPLGVLGLAANARSFATSDWVALLVISFVIAAMRLLITQFRQGQALEQAHASNNLLHSVIEGISDAIYLKDADGHYQLINSAGASYLGLKPEDVIGKTDADLFSPATVAFIRRSDQEMLRSGRPVKVEETLEAAGKTRTILSTKNPYRDPQGRLGGVLGVAVDITHHRVMEEQLRRAQRMESIGTFSGGIAHDFNNLLTVIKGYSQLALAEPRALVQETREYVEQIEKATGRAASLISQLLAFSRRQVLKPRVISLNQTVANIQAMLSRLIGRDIEIETRLAGDLGAVKADPGQMEQILMNLAANARDAMPSGGKLVVETANVLLHSDLAGSYVLPAGDYVVLRVSDNGAGMDAQTQARIFEPFFTTKPAGKGTGLGLATVYGIVKQSGGHISVESHPEVGTTFRIYLPRVHQPLDLTMQMLPRTIGRTAGRTVLVVDDDQQVCRLAVTILSKAGYTVLQACGPQEAERVAAGHPTAIDLLLADVIMPGGGGREAARRVHSVRPTVPVLFMSGHAGDTIVNHGIAEQTAALLQKPFSPDLLVQRVKEAIAQGPRKAVLQIV